MPFTFSHPAAILPLKRLCPNWLSFPALTLGSMAPDVPYFFLRTNLGHSAHTLPGSIKVALPIACMLLVIFYLVRKPLCYLLPAPHRGCLFPLTNTWPKMAVVPLIGILVSLVMGIWTHNFWDAFTHDGGYFVERIALLKHAIWRHDKMTIHAYAAVQQASSLFGLIVIAFCYWRWLIAQPKIAPTESDNWRYTLVSSVAIIGFIVALPVAAYIGSKFNGFGAVKIFVVREAVIAATFFIPTVTLAAVVVYWRHGRNKPGL